MKEAKTCVKSLANGYCVLCITDYTLNLKTGKCVAGAVPGGFFESKAMLIEATHSSDIIDVFAPAESFGGITYTGVDDTHCSLFELRTPSTVAADLTDNAKFTCIGCKKANFALNAGGDACIAHANAANDFC